MTTPRSASNAAKHALARSATIRSVPSLDGSESSPDSKRSALSSSVNSTAGTAATMPGVDAQQDKTPLTTRSRQDGGADTAISRWHGNGVRAVEPSLPHDPSTLSEEVDNGQWDSTIGKAGLGKTGRVINKLVSDNDALKRDIQIERLRAEEAKQAAKLLEDKMERMVNEYEGRLLEANVTKTLLARKERQVESLTGAVELEKRKTQAATTSERSWKDELDRVKNESKVRVDEATSYAQLMEGRYNAISSHWRDQGEEVKRAMTKIKGEITTIVDERKSDDDKITTLRDLCEQQDNNIKELRREKEKIARLFEEYKRTQEEDLKDIKTNAKKREVEQEKQLEEAREALHKLKWALNVKENVKGAQ
ncbi:uncharacterized protein MAM_02052 [Metarhizium album ARSEF 1941]|uniref:Uncharacterized protein n=1 Tax=Metarhizium album (strain ARSEF 1941) TaxID=1081103 RepID=A0A0B2X1B6_METAS|nr:uncharacterized protein MAM_02052 [Metarhizium album ARSEF 1941]KHO00129.1 hypothetical protein MAM_02052 [Metarhizium album ARSEF 1941]